MGRVVALMVLAAACSSASGPSTADLRSVLFTNPQQSAAYYGEAFDSLARARFDTTLFITAGAQVCLKLIVRGCGAMFLSSCDPWTSWGSSSAPPSLT